MNAINLDNTNCFVCKKLKTKSYSSYYGEKGWSFLEENHKELLSLYVEHWAVQYTYLFICAECARDILLKPEVITFKVKLGLI